MMKTRQRVFPAIALLLMAMVLTACSGTQRALHDMAISHETSKAGMEQDSVEIEAGRIELLRSEEGEGREPLVLVHGFAANKETWLRLSQQLWDDFDLIAPDLPGHGDSVQSRDLSYRIAVQAQRLGAILDRLDAERIHLAGNSMGGAIATVYAADNPDRVISLSLISTAGIHEHPAELDRLIDEEGRNPLIIDDSSEYPRLIDFVLEKRPFVPWPISSVMARDFAANHEINQKIFQDIRRDVDSDFRPILSRIEVPTLVLWGAEDRVINVKNASIVANALPDSRLEIMNGIGHAPMIEAPARTAELIRAIAQESR